MSLLPCPSDADLLKMAEERSRRRSFGHALRTAPTIEFASSATSGASYVLEFDGTITLPVRLRVPWSCLVSDNAKQKPALRGSRATVVLTPQYRAAKKAIASLARDAMSGRPPAACPLSLVAKVYVPDNHRRDIVNFSKALHDALTGTVFVDDVWLHDVRWLRAGVDVDAPRAEITVSPLPPSTP